MKRQYMALTLLGLVVVSCNLFTSTPRYEAVSTQEQVLPMTATVMKLASPTETLTSTALPKPTSTSVVSDSILIPTSTCLVSSGNWESKETLDSFGAKSPILTFTVSNCEITAWEIWVFPLPGELLFWQGSAVIPIIDGQFTQAESEVNNGVFVFKGTFDSTTTSSGTLEFPKGFSVFGSIVPKDVSIPWTALPAK